MTTFDDELRKILKNYVEALNYSSKPFVYPKDADEIIDWIRKGDNNAITAIKEAIRRYENKKIAELEREVERLREIACTPGNFGQAVTWKEEAEMFQSQLQKAEHDLEVTIKQNIEWQQKLQRAAEALRPFVGFTKGNRFKEADSLGREKYGFHVKLEYFRNAKQVLRELEGK